MPLGIIRIWSGARLSYIRIITLFLAMHWQVIWAGISFPLLG